MNGPILGDETAKPDVRRHLRQFAEAVEAIGRGEEGRRLQDGEDPDLARLAQAVNALAEQLGRNQRLLGENVRSLQNVNRELRDTQENLVRSEKLATIGRLAAGVAHEIGNPLGAILGYLDILRRTTALDDETRSWLTRMETEARRIDVIIRELLDFARPAETAVQPVDVNEVVASAVSMLSHQKMFAKVTLERDFASDLPRAMAERHRLRQVLVNLLMNSCDAMPEGGRIRITTKLATAPAEAEPLSSIAPRRLSDPPETDYSHLRPRFFHDATRDRPFESETRWVRIEVADEGRGIPAEHLGEVFDPFFTTKPPGKGTGLGLAITLSTIRSFRGRVRIASRVNVGTSILLELPAVR